NPGMISMFGGTLNLNENTKEGLIRELNEELGLEVEDNKISKLAVFKKTKLIDGVDYKIHVYVIKDIEISRLVLNEGKNIYVAELEAALENEKLTRITRLALQSYLQSLN